MNVFVFKNAEGKIVGTTTDSSAGIPISIDSAEFKAYQESLTAPLTPSWDLIRMQRDNLLRETDWVGLKDVVLANKEAWLTYRQALRDIPSTFKTPEEVVWPEVPNK
jgi:hypothetical protein